MLSNALKFTFHGYIKIKVEKLTSNSFEEDNQENEGVKVSEEFKDELMNEK